MHAGDVVLAGVDPWAIGRDQELVVRDDPDGASNLTAVILGETELDERLEAERLEAPLGILAVQRDLQDEQRHQRRERVRRLLEPL